MTNINSTSQQGTDHHCGWEIILPGQTVTVLARKQMVVFGELVNDGELIIEGTLIIED